MFAFFAASNKPLLWQAHCKILLAAEPYVDLLFDYTERGKAPAELIIVCTVQYLNCGGKRGDASLIEIQRPHRDSATRTSREGFLNIYRVMVAKASPHAIFYSLSADAEC